MSEARINDYSARILGEETVFHCTAMVHNLRVLPQEITVDYQPDDCSSHVITRTGFPPRR
jgi:hypothetical protein